MGTPRAVVQARNALRSKPALRAPELVRARCPHPPRPWQNQPGFFSTLLVIQSHRADGDGDGDGDPAVARESSVDAQ
jgi:hypothetical protein